MTPPPRAGDYVTHRQLRTALRRQDSSGFTCWFWVFVFIAFFIVIAIAASFTTRTSHGHSKAHSSSTSSSSVTVPQQERFCRFKMPDAAKRIDDTIYYLGRRFDWQRRKHADGYVHLLYHRDLVSEAALVDQPVVDAINASQHEMPPCTNPFAAGARWKGTEPFVIDAANDQGITERFFFDMNWQSMCEIDSKLNFELFGTRDNKSIADGPDTKMPDGKNEIQFAIMDSQPGVIAVTTVWGVFDGPLEERQIVEADISYNMAFAWGNSSEEGSDVMDGENIATHELMHWAGFGHVSQAHATMQPTASKGETKKRTLLECEVEGLCAHYDEHSTCPGHNSTGSVPPRFEGSTATRDFSLGITVPFLCMLSVVLLSKR